MELYILNKQFEVIEIIDCFTNLIWITRYSGCGECELYIKAEENLFGYLQTGHYIKKINDKECMIIESIQTKYNVETGCMLIVKGRSIKSLLDRRTIISQITMSGTASEVIKRILEENIINPVDTKRKIEIEFKNFAETDKNVELQCFGENVLEKEISILEDAEMGSKMILDNGKFLYILYSGTDRSDEQEDNNRVIFSSEFENLVQSDYTTSIENYKNVAIVGGEELGSKKTVIEVGEAKGLERREIYIDGSEISANDGYITIEEYKNMLKQKGQEEIANYKVTKLFETEVQAVTFKLNQDFFLGDIVTVRDGFGNRENGRILEVIEDYNENGEYRILPTIGGKEHD